MGPSSGLIVAFVVALWAAYFVPLVLRRYDEAGKNSSLDLEGPMRRVVNPEPSEVAEPRPEVRPVAAQPPTTSQSAAPVVRPTITREAAGIAARRRRNTLLTLVGLLAIVTGVAVAGVIAPWWIAAPATLIVAWLVACRLMVRSERGITRSAAPKARRSFTVPVSFLRSKPTTGTKRAAKQPVATAADSEETVVVSDQVEDVAPDRPHVMEDVPLEANALDEQLQIAVPSASAQTGEPLWDPLPVTVPTYVTKPRAGRTVRTIEFGQPGAWTSGHVEGEDTEFPAAKRDDESGDERRAVGH